MIRHPLRPLAWLATLGALGSSAVLVAACSGKTVSNGRVSSTSQPVSLGAVSGTPTPCPAGEAHPNVCCAGGAGQQTECLVYPDAPFTQCENGQTTYPDPRSCCPLDGNGSCAAPPPPPPPSSDGGPGDSCVYACPVGWYPPPGPTPGSSGGSGDGLTCCTTNPDGSGQCTGGGSAGGSGCTCACPSCDPDSGVCPPCPPCNCPSQPPTPPQPSCNACPPGWQVPQGDPLLCCTTDPDGTISCFSQGVPPPPPGGPVDAGPAPSCFGGGGGGPDGSTFTQCGCSETVNGTDYTVTCTDPGASCACTTGSNGGGTTVTEPSGGCSDVSALFAACGFPH